MPNVEIELSGWTEVKCTDCGEIYLPHFDKKCPKCGSVYVIRKWGNYLISIPKK